MISAILVAPESVEASNREDYGGLDEHASILWVELGFRNGKLFAKKQEARFEPSEYFDSKYERPSNSPVYQAAVRSRLVDHLNEELQKVNLDWNVPEDTAAKLRKSLDGVNWKRAEEHLASLLGWTSDELLEHVDYILKQHFLQVYQAEERVRVPVENEYLQVTRFYPNRGPLIYDEDDAFFKEYLEDAEREKRKPELDYLRSNAGNLPWDELRQRRIAFDEEIRGKVASTIGLRVLDPIPLIEAQDLAVISGQWGREPDAGLKRTRGQWHRPVDEAQLRKDLNREFQHQLWFREELQDYIERFLDTRGHHVSTDQNDLYTKLGWVVTVSPPEFGSTWISARRPVPIGMVEIHLTRKADPEDTNYPRRLSDEEWLEIRPALHSLLSHKVYRHFVNLREATDSASSPGDALAEELKYLKIRRDQAGEAIDGETHLVVMVGLQDWNVYFTPLDSPDPRPSYEHQITYFRRFTRARQRLLNVSESDSSASRNLVDESRLRGFQVVAITELPTSNRRFTTAFEPPANGVHPEIPGNTDTRLLLMLSALALEEEVMQAEVASKSTWRDPYEGFGKDSLLALSDFASALQLEIRQEAGRAPESTLRFETLGIRSFHAEIGYSQALTGKLGFTQSGWLLNCPASYSIEGFSTSTPDRTIDGMGEVDEFRNGVELQTSVDPFRNLDGAFMTLNLKLRAEGVHLDEDERFSLDFGDLNLWGAEIECILFQGGPVTHYGNWRDITGTLETGGGDGGGAFVIGGLDARFHHMMGRFLEFDWKAMGKMASINTPSVNVPSLGGINSVRGFRADHIQGNFVWSIQSEVWVPMANFDLPLADTGLIPELVRKSYDHLYFAPFIDVGGAADTPSNSNGTLVGAGVGLRLHHKDAVIRADWGFGVYDSVQGDHDNLGYVGMVIPFDDFR